MKVCSARFLVKSAKKSLTTSYIRVSCQTENSLPTIFINTQYKMRSFCLVLFLAYTAFGCKQDTPKENKLAITRLPEVKPRNVIFILADDHRFDFMGFTGKVPWLKTPNMDRLAKEGAYFKNTFVTTALCSPSRASILTGLYSHTHTVVDNQAPDPKMASLRQNCSNRAKED